MTTSSLQRFSPWPHRVAVVLCCATFPLIWLGGLVTTYDAGMAVPDWPTTYGYNLFLYPWKTWVFGPFDLFIEHGHRLMGALVGLLSIAFVTAVFTTDRRQSRRTASVAMFLLVLAQGLLGGARVQLDERVLALLHACLGLATFGYAAAMAVVSSRYWHDAQSASEDVMPAGSGLIRLCVLTMALTYAQVVLGALLRHVPTGATPGFFRVAVLFHIAMGLAVFVHVLLLASRAWRRYRTMKRISVPIFSMVAFVAIQIGLGGGTWVLKYGWPTWFAEQAFAAGYTIQANSLPQATITTLHVAVGAIILALSVVVTLRAWRLVLAPGMKKPQEKALLQQDSGRRPPRAALAYGVRLRVLQVFGRSTSRLCGGCENFLTRASFAFRAAGFDIQADRWR